MWISAIKSAIIFNMQYTDEDLYNKVARQRRKCMGKYL